MTFEQRWHPLREEWVVIAAHRQDRPWRGEEAHLGDKPRPAYDPTCYLCPGNRRVSGKLNPPYTGIFVFDNDHPCVAMDAPKNLPPPPGFYRNCPAQGIARVLCYTPRHDLSLAELELPEVVALLKAWRDQYVELGSLREINHVLIFENKGEVVGVSNPHPHCQIYATNFVFKIIETEIRSCQRFREETGRMLFSEILATEKADGRRILAENDSAIAFIPYFARYAYETFVAPKAPHLSLATLSDREIEDLAAVLLEVTIRFDNLWEIPFPYVLALHQAPTDGGDYSAYHFHMEFHPPLRKPNLLKYLAGPEIGGGCFISDTSPEAKAAELQAVSTVHYKKRKKPPANSAAAATPAAAQGSYQKG